MTSIIVVAPAPDAAAGEGCIGGVEEEEEEGYECVWTDDDDDDEDDAADDDVAVDDASLIATGLHARFARI